MFLAKDVAEWIDYCKTGNGFYDVSGMLKTVDPEEKTVVMMNIVSPGGSTQNERSAISGARPQTFLTEEGLYEVLMLSRKPIAKQFKKQVKEILKTIRKTGNSPIAVRLIIGSLSGKVVKPWFLQMMKK